MRDIGAVDVVAAANAIVHAARRRQSRQETLRGIAPVVALALIILASVAAMTALLTASSGISLWCALFGHCAAAF